MSLIPAALLVGLVSLANADPAASLLSGEQLLGRNKLKEAHAAFQSVADNARAPASIRAEAELRLGCMAVEFEGASNEAARSRFARALQLFPKVASPADWNPTCADLLLGLRGEARPAPPPPTPKPTPRPGNVVDRAQLEKERQERVRLQEKLEALNAEMAAAKSRNASASSADPEARDRLSRLEQTIDSMRQELKERDDRLLAMSLKPDSSSTSEPAIKRPFERRLTVPTIVFGSLAVAALGTGIGFGVDARSKKLAFMGTTYQADAARFSHDGTRSQMVADSCFGGAIALAATAALVFVFQGPPAEEHP
jgi:hypothetical protein